MIEEGPFIGWGYRPFKLLLFVLIAAGVVFLSRLVISRLGEPDLEEHRPQLELLELAYDSRRAELVRRAGERVKNAPNEVLAIQYQQDLNSNLAGLERCYFADRQAIAEGDYTVLEENWAEEIRLMGEEGGDDEVLSPEP